ncbi:MAG: hypothetical protein IAF08_15105 [Rhizobacter sp.]|nr:hypothetical protein [Chlorobiales bacterium]
MSGLNRKILSLLMLGLFIASVMNASLVCARMCRSVPVPVAVKACCADDANQGDANRSDANPDDATQAPSDCCCKTPAKISACTAEQDFDLSPVAAASPLAVAALAWSSEVRLTATRLPHPDVQAIDTSPPNPHALLQTFRI